MRRSFYSDRVEEIHGFKYITLKSGRRISFWDAKDAVDTAYTAMSTALSRAFKLADNEYDLERLEWFIDNLSSHIASVKQEIERRRGVKTQEERIALLRNTMGRTTEEAEMFRKKADELELKLRSRA